MDLRLQPGMLPLTLAEASARSGHTAACHAPPGTFPSPRAGAIGVTGPFTEPVLPL
jgi:hypothetical protein